MSLSRRPIPQGIADVSKGQYQSSPGHRHGPDTVVMWRGTDRVSGVHGLPQRPCAPELLGRRAKRASGADPPAPAPRSDPVDERKSDPDPVDEERSDRKQPVPVDEGLAADDENQGDEGRAVQATTLDTVPPDCDGGPCEP